jgi:glycosyltransferase involved in cell wall biosynthesis
MSSPPPWTIAIPTYNGQSYLADTLRSVMNQTDQGFELIVSDDLSSDDSLEIVKKICGNRATVYLNQSGQNLGLAGNWNRCVELSSGSWVTILHQDDLLTPVFFETHHKIASENTDLGMITGPAPLIDSSGRVIDSSAVEDLWNKGRFSKLLPGRLAGNLVCGNPIRCPATSFRKDLHKQVGGFSDQWKYVVDWYFWYRVSQSSSVGILDSELAYQRWHPNSETQRLAKSTRDLEENAMLMGLILDENFTPHPDHQHLNELIKTRMAKAWFNRAYTAAKHGDRSLQLKSLQNAIRADYLTITKACLKSPKTLLRMITGNLF